MAFLYKKLYKKLKKFFEKLPIHRLSESLYRCKEVKLVSHNSINSLIIKTAHRDNEAFEQLYIEMKKPVYYYALRFCGNHDIAEDVMQDTFITIWSKSSTFLPSGSGRAWILSIAKNKTLDIMKKNQRECSLEEIEMEYSDDNQLLNAFDEKTILGELLRSLNSRESDIVVLRHVVGLNLTEIAKEKNIKKGTVFWLYNSAIKKLRKAYERIEHNEKENRKGT